MLRVGSEASLQMDRGGCKEKRRDSPAEYSATYGTRHVSGICRYPEKCALGRSKVAPRIKEILFVLGKEILFLSGAFLFSDG